jgi:hypothetical protein
MKAKIEQGFASRNVYRHRRKPIVPNDLHLKSWRYGVAPASANDPVWIKRCADYWQLQAETYGIRYHDDMAVMVDFGLGIVTTAIHVAEALPGRRTKDFTVARVAEGASA